MIESSHLFGGFSISPSLARRVFEAMAEMQAQNVDASLSHVDDDNCDVCRRAREQAAKESTDATTGPDRPGHRWTA